MAQTIRSKWRPDGAAIASGILTLLLPAFLWNGCAPRALHSSEYLPQMERRIHQQINNHRESIGLSPLQLNSAITEQARLHSRAMATGERQPGHDGFDERMAAIEEEIQRGDAAENVGVNWGMDDPAATAVRLWLESPQHRANIEGGFQLTGIGVAKNDEGRYYFTQIFVGVE